MIVSSKRRCSKRISFSFQDSTRPSPVDPFDRGLSILNANGEILIDFSDEYDHQTDNIEYVPENILQATDIESESYRIILKTFHSYIAQSCGCSSVEPGAQLCGENALECQHGRNYTRWIDNQGRRELVLNPQRPPGDLIYECCEQCICPTNCDNRLVQFGPRKYLQIVDLAHLKKNLGLITLHDIPLGAFVCEYAGEILTQEEVRRRHKANDATNADNYIICLNERSMATDGAHVQTFIDPSRRGNIGRYLNHSCDPNCEILSVRVDGFIPKLGECQ